MINQWQEHYSKRMKPILFIQLVGSFLIFILLVNNFIFGFSLLQFKLIFWLLAIVSFALAMEDMLLKKRKSVYMLKFSTTIVYLLFPFFFLN